MQELARTRGRIRVLPSERPGLVQIDLGEARLGAFRAFVAPGKHSIAIDRGTPSERRLDVTLGAGEEYVVDPTRPAAPTAPTMPVPVPAASSSPPPPAPAAKRREPPFSPYVLVAASGVTAVSVVVPWLTWRRARRLADHYDDSGTTLEERRELYDDYDRAKTTYAWSWAVPALAGGATGLLSVWYLTGGRDAVTIDAVPGRDSGYVGMRGSF